jgi:putative oxidoreductase
MDSLMRTLSPLARLLLAALFLFSGLGKIAAPGQTMSMIAHAGLPFPPLAYGGAVAAELGGGLLLLIGWQTRWAALVLAAFTVAAALAFHADFGDQNQLIHFMKNLAIAGGLLQLAATGAGAFSLDARTGAPAA